MVVSNIFYFHPYFGKIPILTHIFQMRLKPPTSILIFFIATVLSAAHNRCTFAMSPSGTPSHCEDGEEFARILQKWPSRFMLVFAVFTFGAKNIWYIPKFESTHLCFCSGLKKSGQLQCWKTNTDCAPLDCFAAFGHQSTLMFPWTLTETEAVHSRNSWCFFEYLHHAKKGCCGFV